MDRAVDAVNLGAAGGDLSLWGLFIQADIVVKLVMLGLLGASVWVWAVVFEKWTTLRRVNRRPTASRIASGPAAAWTSCSTRKATSPNHPMAAVFAAAMGEWRAPQRVAGAGHVADRRAGTDRPRDRRDGAAARWTGSSAG